VFSFVLAGLLGYVLGSVPSAYLLVRWKSRLDVRYTGSGNVGALNSYQVTGSFLIGAAVLFVDAAKGIAAVSLSGLLAGNDFPHGACAGLLSIIGHNFPVWLRFRGGRGLATAAGAITVFCWPVLPAWGVLWAAAYALLRSVNTASAVASVLLPLVLALIPGGILTPFLSAGTGEGEFALYFAASMIVVLVKLVEPVRTYISQRRQSPARLR
jgi:glycerol-3-phosphate acyltransferase PlsY